MTKVTIIIPTYNRPNYLRRILDYYREEKNDFEIISADSSSDENKKLNKKIISLFSNLKILYLDNYPDKINPWYKFADATNYAKSKYCLFCADDDFITLNGINKAVDFLENNPDFVVAHGRYMGFYLKTKKNGEKQFCWRPIYHQESIISPNPAVRLKSHLSNYLSPTIYAVYRIDFLKMIYKELLSSKVDPLLFGELLPSMITLIYGKMKRLDILYAARQVYPKNGYWPSLMDFIKEGKYDQEYIKFRKCLATHLSKVALMDAKEAEKIIDDGMDVYLKNSFFNLNCKIKNAFNRLGLPFWLEEKIKSIYRTMFSAKPIKGFPDYLDGDDFNKIRNCVLSHSKK